MRIIRPATLGDDMTLDSTNVPEVPPAVYAGGTTYADGALASVLQPDGYTYKVYESLQAGNTGNTPDVSPLFWLFLADTYGEYAGGTTYDLDDLVISPADHRVYQSLQGSNTGHSLSDAAWWLDIAPTNAYAMFDNSNTTQTERGDEIVVVLEVEGRADAVSLLNIVAATVRIQIETTADGEIYDETFDMISDSGVNDWWEYYFEPVIRRGDIVVFNLPMNSDPTFTITLSDPGGTAKVGAAVVGLSRDLGPLLYGARVGIQDYSRKEADEFGNFTIVQRAFSKKAVFKCMVQNTAIDSIAALLAQYRATACVFVGTDDPPYTSTWIYGFYRDFSIEIAFMEKSYLNIEIEGLT